MSTADFGVMPIDVTLRMIVMSVLWTAPSIFVIRIGSMSLFISNSREVGAPTGADAPPNFMVSRSGGVPA